MLIAELPNGWFILGTDMCEDWHGWVKFQQNNSK